MLEPVVITLTTDKSGPRRMAFIDHPLVMYDIHVTDRDGSVVPPTLFTKFLRDPRNFHGTHSGGIGEGAFHEAQLPLNRGFDLSMGGTYHVYATRQFADPHEPSRVIEVRSNTLDFTIHERLAPAAPTPPATTQAARTPPTTLPAK